MGARRAWAGLAAAIALIAAPAAWAAGLEITPARLDLAGAERAASLTVRNLSDRPMSLQVRPLDWTQQDGEDRLAPSARLVASPPAFELGPGQAQTVRVAILRAPEGAGEAAWRLVIDELPRVGETGGEPLVRILAPVFLTPPGAAPARLAWSARRQGEDVVLTAENRGGVHERLATLSVTAAGRAGAPALGGYVLAGAARTWRLPGLGGAGVLTLSGQGETDAVRAVVRPVD